MLEGQEDLGMMGEWDNQDTLNARVAFSNNAFKTLFKNIAPVVSFCVLIFALQPSEAI